MANPKKKLLIPPISPAAPGPLYRQIVEGVKSEICAGRLERDTRLPSFRILAEEWMVSLITVQRAFEELERDGVIYRKQGLGTFVSENGMTRIREIKKERAEELMNQAIREASEAGLSKAEVLQMARRRFRKT